jgi:xylulokinase
VTQTGGPTIGSGLGPGSSSPLVAGVDSSTQSCKVLVVDAESGTIVRAGAAAHPDGTAVDPAHWWDAYGNASAQADLSGVSALSVAAQQHGMVALDAAGEVVRPALLWNDVRSAPQARAMVERLGAQAWADAVGSVPLPAFTVTKLAWLAENEPEHAAAVASVLLPHDWLTWCLLDRATDPVTDRSDASGTGYWSPATNDYRADLFEQALGHSAALPRVLGPAEAAGASPDGIVVGPGAGDNAAAALGLGLQPGEVAVSLGTSGALFAATERPTADGTGIVAGFADATGRQLPLCCTLNAARVLTATAAMLGTDLAGLDVLANQAAPDAGGLTLLPYLDGERTPDLPTAAGSLHGLRRANMTPENLARAAVLGLLCGLADALDAMAANEIAADQVLLIGGASKSTAVRAAAPDIFAVPVVVPAEAEYVALGAARQAAWVAWGEPDPPVWKRDVLAEAEPSGLGWGAAVRERYDAVRHAAYGI